MFLWWHLRRLRESKGFSTWNRDRDAGRDAATAAIRKIGSYRGNPRAIAALVSLLDGEETELGLAAANALRGAGWEAPSALDRAKLLIAARNWRHAIDLGEPAMKPLADLLRHSGEWHGQIVDALNGTSCPAAVEPLRVILERGALSTLQFAWRERAAEILGELSTKEALDALIENLNLPWVPKTLLARKSDMLMDRLAVALEHDKPGVRAGAAALLGEWGDPRAARPLLAAFKREPPSDPLPFTADAIDVRSHVGTALMKLGPAALDSYIAALSDEDPQLRACAARGLAGLGDPRAADGLLTALERDRAASRQGHSSGWSQSLLAIAEALGAVKDSRAIPVLAACLSDALLRSAGDMDSRGRYGVAIDEYQAGSWWSAVVEAALNALTGLGPEAVPIILRGLVDEDAHVRMRAAQALGRAGHASAAPKLVDMLQAEPDECARRECVAALQRLTGQRLTDGPDWQSWLESTHRR